MKNYWTILITEGDYEPWVFLDGWEENIKERMVFEYKKDAVQKYLELLKLYKIRYKHSEKRGLSIFGFWNEGEEVYCEACDEFLQVFHGLLFLENDLIYDFDQDEESKRELLSIINEYNL
jgi:hypothetical protein